MKTLTIILSALFLFSCKPKQVTIEGRLMADCNVPLANQSGTIHQKGMYAGKVADFTSDENGYFKAVFEPKNSGEFRIAIEGGGTILQEIRFAEYLTLEDVYVNPPLANYYIYLDVKNPYTSSDTLLYYDWNYPQNGASSWNKKVAGPFSSGLLYSVFNAPNPHALPVNYGIQGELPLTYWLNGLPTNGIRKMIPTPYCSGQNQNITLVIE